RAFSSGVRFFLAICNTSDVVLLFYTTSEVYTKFGMVSMNLKKMARWKWNGSAHFLFSILFSRICAENPVAA
ncbi:hypothetical protein, partial [Dysosmobacter sp. HCP28S3_G4]|uniref:hypothetical protein n=1 Tax=Dysosmobacter sp. HCP28S3_G4 TaxID=3438938 RepID=UPI003F8A632A